MSGSSEQREATCDAFPPRTVGRALYSLAPTSAALRNLYAVVAVVSAFGVVLASVVGGGVGGFLVLGFVLVGPGCAVVSWLRLPAVVGFAAVPVLGLSAVVGATTVAAWLGLWPADQILLVLVTFALASGVVRLARARPGGEPLVLPALRGRRVPGMNWPAVVIVVALVGWLAALPSLRDTAYSQFGLLGTPTGPLLVVVTLLVVGAFAWALRVGRIGTAVAAVGATIVVQRLTVTLVTDMPLYGWTYKHIGVVDYVERFGGLPPAGVDIYREWPGFFTALAWFSDVTGVAPVAVAHFFAPVVHVLLAVLVAAAARVMGLGYRAALVAAMVAELVNWVGQDYYSPQALAYVLAVGFITALVAAKRSPTAAVVAVVVFCAVVPTHQLTPFWLFGVTVALAVLKQVPRWIVVPLGAVLALYLLLRLDVVAPFGLFSGVNLVENASSTPVAGVFGKIFTSVVCRMLSAGVLAAAFAAAVVNWRRRRPFLIPSVVAFSSLGLLAGQSYGGEAVFRVYLYSIVGCSVLIAPYVLRALTVRGEAVAPRAGLVFLAVLAAGGLQGYYGLWHLVVTYPSQVPFAEKVLGEVQPPAAFRTPYLSAALLTRVSAAYVPFALADKNFDSPLVVDSPDFYEGFPNRGQFEELTASALEGWGDTYFVFSTQSTLATYYYGYLPEGSVEEFVAMLRASADWNVVAEDEHNIAFKIVKK